MIGGDADAAIADGNMQLTGMRCDGNFDRVAAGGVLQGIAHQIKLYLVFRPQIGRYQVGDARFVVNDQDFWGCQKRTSNEEKALRPQGVKGCFQPAAGFISDRLQVSVVNHTQHRKWIYQ